MAKKHKKLKQYGGGGSSTTIPLNQYQPLADQAIPMNPQDYQNYLVAQNRVVTNSFVPGNTVTSGKAFNATDYLSGQTLAGKDFFGPSKYSGSVTGQVRGKGGAVKTKKDDAKKQMLSDEYALGYAEAVMGNPVFNKGDYPLSDYLDPIKMKLNTPKEYTDGYWNLNPTFLPGFKEPYPAVKGMKKQMEPDYRKGGNLCYMDIGGNLDTAYIFSQQLGTADESRAVVGKYSNRLPSDFLTTFTGGKHSDRDGGIQINKNLQSISDGDSITYSKKGKKSKKADKPTNNNNELSDAIAMVEENETTVNPKYAKGGMPHTADKIAANSVNRELARVRAKNEQLKGPDKSKGLPSFMWGGSGGAELAGQNEGPDMWGNVSKYGKGIGAIGSAVGKAVPSGETDESWQGIREGVASSGIPMADMFHGISKAGEGLGQAVGGDTGGNVMQSMWADPAGRQMEIFKGDYTKKQKALAGTVGFLLPGLTGFMQKGNKEFLEERKKLPLQTTQNPYGTPIEGYGKGGALTDKEKSLSSKYSMQMEPWDKDPEGNKAKGFDYWNWHLENSEGVKDYKSRMNIMNAMAVKFEAPKNSVAPDVLSEYDATHIFTTPEQADRSYRFNQPFNRVGKDLRPKKPSGYKEYRAPGQEIYGKGGSLPKYAKYGELNISPYAPWHDVSSGYDLAKMGDFRKSLDLRNGFGTNPEFNFTYPRKIDSDLRFEHPRSPESGGPYTTPDSALKRTRSSTPEDTPGLEGFKMTKGDKLGLASAIPATAWNVSNFIAGYDKESPIFNPEYGRVKWLMRDRNIDFQALSNEIRAERNRTEGFINRSTDNAVVRRNNLLQLSANTQQETSSTNLKGQMADIQLRGEEAQMLDVLGREHMQARETARQLEDANKATWKGYGTAAAENIGESLSRTGANMNTRQMNELKLKIINSYPGVFETVSSEELNKMSFEDMIKMLK